MRHGRLLPAAIDTYANHRIAAAQARESFTIFLEARFSPVLSKTPPQFPSAVDAALHRFILLWLLPTLAPSARRLVFTLLAGALLTDS